ncbi:hypothetical protein [Sphingobacterium faecium]|uniref:hypothetical protein n=1 Tax=Sphingobacterium faecium TaxID=34087 RepID=UPI003209D986
MRTLLKRAIGATSVCALAAGMVLGANAFTKNDGEKEVAKVDKTVTTQQWHLKNNEPLSNAKNASAYELVSSMNTLPDCDGIPEVPCTIEFDTSNPSTPDLQSYLNTFQDPSDVTAAAIETRSE